MTRVLFFSEDRSLHSLLCSALGKEFSVTAESIADGAIRPDSHHDYDVALVDLNSHHESARDHIAMARRMVESQLPVVIMADDGLRPTAQELVRAGAFGYCRRPPSIRDLRIMLRRAHEEWSTKRIEAASAEPVIPSCDGLIGASPQMLHVYDLIRSVADINVSVLITGQSGTGKELIARAIHNLGARSRRPFVAVACGAIPETLIESELFGHEKGAYTGTVGSREGYLEQAGDGTLLLDEVAELSPFTQVKLLRVLQQREFSRLGTNKLIPLRARLIFATNRNLPEMVAQSKLREDLYYRMNVVHIESPALEERRDDIPLIAAHFLRYYSRQYQKPMDRIEPQAMALLQKYRWPGNVRELENVIQRAIVFAEGAALRVADLPVCIQEENVIGIDACPSSGSFERQLRDFKIRLMETALREHNGNKTLAARSLSISRAYLHRLIRLSDPDTPFDSEDQAAETG